MSPTRICKSPSVFLTALSLAIVTVALLWAPGISCQSSQGVKLILRSVEYPQNVTVSIMDIGEGDAALACQTDRRPCCRINRIGEWYFPNGSLVRTEGHGDDFYRNRGDNGTVRLNRRGNSVAYPEGTFRCVVPDANNISRTIYVGLVKSGGVIKHLYFNSNNSEVLCVTSGGPATLVYSDNINNIMTGKHQNSIGTNAQLKITVGVTNTLYNNTLRADRSDSYYVCVARNFERTSFAALLSDGQGEPHDTSQLVGRVGETLTLLCLAAEGQVQSASWVGSAGNNITFTRLKATDSGVYMCSGNSTAARGGVVSHSVNLTISDCSAVVYIQSSQPRGVVDTGQRHMLTYNALVWGTSCAIEAHFIHHEGQLKSNTSTLEFSQFRLSDAGYYTCTVTLNGFNFTSRPAFTPEVIQITAPDVSISSDLSNPISSGSHPTLTCTIVLDASVDVEVGIEVSWRGPAYGLGEYTLTAPVVNGSAEVPTYTSTAELDAYETFYDSGPYGCSAVLRPLTNSDFIRNSPSSSRRTIQVLFKYPRRPVLRNTNKGSSWIKLTWNQRPSDNITNYEVKYSYVGECGGVSKAVVTRRIDGGDSSYNVTGLGEYFNYSINLTAINRDGTSPPFITFELTRPEAPSAAPGTFATTTVYSTNLTLQWGRVVCRERNSEIEGYSLRWSLNGSQEGEESISGVGDEDRQYTISRLQPRSSYTINIAAVNGNGQRGPDRSITVNTAFPENVPFQVQMIGVHSCLQWRISDPEDKVHDVIEGIVRGINQHCPHCAINSDDITDGEFVCFPGSPNQVTFRGKVQDRAEATAREVILFVELWTTSSNRGVTIPVHHARLNINNTCIALLASLDDVECPGYLQTTDTTITTTTERVRYTDATSTNGQNPVTAVTSVNTQLPTTTERGPLVVSQSQSDTGVVVGGVVAITFIITAAVVTVLLVWIVLKYRRTSKRNYQSAPEELQGGKDEMTMKSKVIDEDGDYVNIERQTMRTKDCSQPHPHPPHSDYDQVNPYARGPSSQQTTKVEGNPEVDNIYDL